MADPRNLTTNIRNQILLLNARQKATRKGQEIAKLKGVSRTPRRGFDIEIQAINAIEGGVEVFARAWHPNGRQVGFGEDGTVEIERFRIFNPPLLVDDPAGDIVQEWDEEQRDGTFLKVERRLREDAQEALLQVLEHNLSVMKNIYDDELIVRGKIGRTTSTFFPDGNPETSSVDGFVLRSGVNEAWGTIRAGAGTGAADSNNAANGGVLARTSASTTSNQYADLIRGIVGFDTSAIPDTDDIDSATLSLYGHNVDENHGVLGALALNIYGATPASNTALANGDFANTGTTAFSSAILTTNWADGFAGNPAEAYNNFALNASGLANISKVGVSNFSLKLTQDSDNSAPTWASSGRDGGRSYPAEETGTTKDPKLVVEHSVSATIVTPAAQVVTASIPAYSVHAGTTIGVSAQVATFSIPAFTISLPKLVGVNVQTATFSIPAYSVDAGGNITVAVGVSTATFSIPAYAVLKGWVQAVNTLTATFSTPAPTIGQGTGVTVTPSAQVVTMSIPAYTVVVVASIIVAVSAQVLTFSLPTLSKVGAIWRKIARSTNATWSRVSRNSN